MKRSHRPSSLSPLSGKDVSRRGSIDAAVDGGGCSCRRLGRASLAAGGKEQENDARRGPCLD